MAFLSFSDLPISIHAPTWGATTFAIALFCLVPFQSTHPRGVRRRAEHGIPGAAEISIHAPTWGATVGKDDYGEFTEFQSTHPRGVRRRYRDACGGIIHFNPRTHVGCDLPSFTVVLLMEDFNPRTHVGCDPLSISPFS